MHTVTVIKNEICKKGIKNPFQFLYDYDTKKVSFQYKNYNYKTNKVDIVWDNNEASEMFINIYDNYDDICKIKNGEITNQQLNISSDIKELLCLHIDIHYYTHDGYCSDSENEHEYSKITKYVLFKFPSYFKDYYNNIIEDLFKNKNINKWYDKHQSYKLKNNESTELFFNEWDSETSRNDGSHDYCTQMEEYEPINYYLILL